MEKGYMPTPILICVAAIILNLCGMFVVKNFELPLYLDTIATEIVPIAVIAEYSEKEGLCILRERLYSDEQNRPAVFLPRQDEIDHHCREYE